MVFRYETDIRYFFDGETVWAALAEAVRGLPGVETVSNDPERGTMRLVFRRPNGPCGSAVTIRAEGGPGRGARLRFTGKAFQPIGANKRFKRTVDAIVEETAHVLCLRDPYPRPTPRE